ncbi:MAG: trypsin-like peptidase domain-containing protein [Bacteroidales bacterium]|nr:trypsin-like peptidase domain-containing protein [Bacteroidales bacterium]
MSIARLIFLFTAFSLFYIPVKGQISYGGKPIDVLKYSLSEVPVIVPDCREEQKPMQPDSGPRFKVIDDALICDIYKDLTEIAKQTLLEDGTKVWRLGISSKGANSLSLVFSKYHVSKGVRIFVYDENQKEVFGSFTHFNNKTFGKMAIQPVHSSLLYVEMQVLPFVKHPGEIEIGYVAKTGNQKHSDNTLKDKYFGISGFCNVDINCINNQIIQQQKHGVVRIVYDGKERCTGTLINNTRENAHPYLLTANHCIPSQYYANTGIFFFNYESPECGGGDGGTSLSISGAKLIATSPCIGRICNLDFSLLELSENVPFYYHPYFTGWDNRDNEPMNAYTIHHPQGDVKKISFENDKVITGDYGNGFDANTFWHVAHWETGTTEEGSSGAGLFNENNLLVGTLTGGLADCNQSVNDYFQKFHNCWDDYPYYGHQLKFWLDPNETNHEFIEGYDPYFYFWKSGDTLSNIDVNQDVGLFYTSSGIASGHNADFVTRFAERFSLGRRKKSYCIVC